VAHDNAPLSTGTEVRAVDFPPAVSNSSDTAITNITATVYTTGTPEVGARFMAPTSGRVAITVSAGIRVDSATAPGDRIFIGYQVFVGDPADNDLLQIEEVKYGLSNIGAADATEDYQFGGHTAILGGLEPGTFYYARVRYRTTLGNGTADIQQRGITVIPIP
jgi:hypothetical protein